MPEHKKPTEVVLPIEAINRASSRDQHADEEGRYGDADTLSKAKNVSVKRLANLGMVQSQGGKVRLLRADKLALPTPDDNPSQAPAWLACHWLVRALDTGGEQAAASLLACLGAVGDAARELAYRLYAV
ncbi:MAG: hypothetical protein RMM31_02310 [Anaerolineae bacterium]|nr:hypothetical protein [Thermoflexales bacterium]MDW8395055.1 hypothetical protein [Anaerolineae bacterium]